MPMTADEDDAVTRTKPKAQSAPTSNLFWPEKQKFDNANGHDDQAEKQEDDPLSQVLDSILKVHCTHSEPDYLIPWQRQHQSTSTSSGFVIELPPLSPSNNEEGEDNKDSATAPTKPRRVIMTNAHSVEYGSVVQVQRRGGDHKYEAKILVICNECDLALLTVEAEENDDGDDDDEDKDELQNVEEFWKDLKPLPFGALPDLQQKVEVLGYPTGGSSLSITQGVVSRIELQEYSQASTHLLAVQIDAAINSGNSGGPVINSDQEVIGVAFQGLDGAENIGYVVPVTVVQHVLQGLVRNKNNTDDSRKLEFEGFCSLGISYIKLENKGFRKSLGMLGQNLSGIMIKDCAPTSPSRGILFPNDVICEIDGIDVANDGKIFFRRGERVSLSCYVQTKFVGETVQLKVWRNRGMVNLDVKVGNSRRLVPAHFDNRPPPYIIVAGFVFTALSVPYLYASNAWDDYVSDDISYLVNKWHQSLPQPGDQAVVLSHVLAHRENLGYEMLTDLLLDKVNDKKVRSLLHLQELLLDKNDEGNGFVRLTFSSPHGNIVVLEKASIQRVTEEVCQEHSIPKPFCLYDPENANDGVEEMDVDDDDEEEEAEDDDGDEADNDDER